MSELAIRRAATDNAPTEYTAEVLDLLSAIREALNIPLAATAEYDRRRVQVLDHRVIDVTTIINSIIQFGDLFTATEQAQKLREWASRSPADYTPWNRSSDAEPAEEPGGGAAR